MIRASSASALSPTAFGYIVDWTGNWQLPFILSLGLLLIGAGLSFKMHPEVAFEDEPAAPIADRTWNIVTIGQHALAQFYERGDEGIARIKELTNGVGADSVLECVGTEESMMQAIQSTRPGGSVGYVGVPHGMRLDVFPVFFKLVRLHGGPAPVRRYLPDLIKLVWDRKIEPGKVFDLVLPLEQVAEGYRAMDERRAIKTLLRT